MKYIGLFSGKIYEDKSEANECCVTVKDDDERLKKETEYDEWKLKKLQECIKCLGCPKASL